ncbi:excisionase [Intrasporangium sp.]|uniref:excisionase n=1 Tax=Intrasporangium sp. TaxID=1925024 RepID=UPI00336596C5
MTIRLNDAQRTMLTWLAAGPADGQATNSQRVTARALATRRLVKIKGRGSTWRAELTAAGRHYLENGDYPAGHHHGTERKPSPDLVPAPPKRHSTVDKRAAKAKSEPALSVDSPAGRRRRRGRPAGDGLFVEGKRDPYDEKILITVKEAAWMLSLPEHAIRQAVSFGDLDRVFIGEGGKNYRIVYGSLLAWVNSMPRESAKVWW